MARMSVDGEMRCEASVTELTAQEERAEALGNLADPVFIMHPVVDESGAYVDLEYAYLNAAAERLYGLSSTDVIGRTQLDMFPSVRETGLLEAYFATLATREAGSLEIPTFDENGIVGSFLLEFSAVRGDLLIIARDITAQRVAESRVAGQASRLSAILDNSLDGVSVYGSDLRFTYVNKRVEELSGIPASRWLGASHEELGFSAQQASFWEGHIGNVFSTGRPDSFTYQVDNTEGPSQWFEAVLAPEIGTDGSVTHVISTNRNVTARIEAESRLRDLTTHDPLTGVFNRRGLLEELNLALKSRTRTGRPLAVVMVDLDRFKTLNDARGHSIGDDLLEAVAERLASSVRGGDLVARTGGDEFAVVMRDLASAPEALTMADRIVEEFRSPFVLHGEEVFSTLSVGVVVADRQRNPNEVLRDADSALYAAKAAGRDRVHVFNDELRINASRRLTLEADLRHALDRDELELWYQPEVDLRTGRIVAAEALIRWRRPGGIVLGADHFVGIAEETRLIMPIGAWVFEQACATAATWPLCDGKPLTVRVNFSALQLEDPTLVDSIQGIIRNIGIDPSRVCAEITETVLLRGLESTRVSLEAMRDLGMGIAIDDFGTGFASITYLSEYPVTVLKIDRAFTSRLVQHPRGSRLVSGLVTLAEVVGVGVTAEGVETDQQASALRDLGCPTAQGFLYSPAIPAEEFAKLWDVVFPHE